MIKAKIASWPLYVRLPVALLAGAFGAIGQAPLDIPIATFLSLCLGFVLWRSETMRAGLLGLVFGTGYFALTLVWIIEPFQVDAARHGWMAPFALFFLSTGLALFWAAAFWVARRFSDRALVLVFTWAGAELLRAYIFTGFPWGSPAQVAIHGPISILLSVGGPHLTTFLLLALAAVVSAPAQQTAHIRMRLGQGCLLLAAGLALSLPHARPSTLMTDHRVRLVQPNVPQELKWRPDLAEAFLERQINLTKAPPAKPDQAPDLVIWPETAIPWLLDTAAPVLPRIAAAGQGAVVVLGALRAEQDTLRNSLAVLDEQGTVIEIYDKHHLVPFGEYIPFKGLAESLGLQALAANMGGFSKGPGPRVLDFGPLGKALPLICYEAVFAHGVNKTEQRPAFLLQITNDAWFGAYAGPQQHLAQARMRAIEQGLPLMRAANTGISAMIDPTGRVIQSLPLGNTGFLDAVLPEPLPATIYSRTGDWPMIALITFGLVLTVVSPAANRFRVND